MIRLKVAVIGAGIVGASVAYHLLRQGVEVVLVDRGDQGQATAAGAGIVCPWLSSRSQDEDWYRMANAGARYYASLVSELASDGERDVGYERIGAMAVSRDDETLHQIEKQVKKWRKETPDVGEIARLSPSEAKKLFPPLDQDLGAVHITGAARVDGRKLRDALKRVAQKRGVELRIGEAKLATAHGEITGVRVFDEFIPADAVVVTAGAWAASLLKPLGLDLAVEPQRGQIVHLKLPGTDTAKWPVVLPQSSHYMLAFADSRVVVGATRESGSGFDYRMTAGGLQEVLNEALSVAPGLAEGTVHEMRVGFRPVTCDHLPLLGTVSEVSGLVIATGLGPSGLTMGPYVGRLAADLVTGKRPEVALAPYGPLRHSAKRESQKD